MLVRGAFAGTPAPTRRRRRAPPHASAASPRRRAAEAPASGRSPTCRRRRRWPCAFPAPPDVAPLAAAGIVARLGARRADRPRRPRPQSGARPRSEAALEPARRRARDRTALAHHDARPRDLPAPLLRNGNADRGRLPPARDPDPDRDGDRRRPDLDRAADHARVRASRALRRLDEPRAARHRTPLLVQSAGVDPRPPHRART